MTPLSDTPQPHMHVEQTTIFAQCNVAGGRRSGQKSRKQETKEEERAMNSTGELCKPSYTKYFLKGGPITVNRYQFIIDKFTHLIYS